LPVISTGVRDRVLAIRIWKAQLNATDSASLGGLRAPPVLGEASSIGQLVGLGDFLFLRRGLYRQAIHVIFLIAGIVALLRGLTIACDGSFLVLRMVPALRSHVCSYPLIDPPKIWDMNDLRGPPFGVLVIRLHLKMRELSLWCNVLKNCGNLELTAFGWVIFAHAVADTKRQEEAVYGKETCLRRFCR